MLKYTKIIKQLGASIVVATICGRVWVWWSIESNCWIKKIFYHWAYRLIFHYWTSIYLSVWPQNKRYEISAMLRHFAKFVCILNSKKAHMKYDWSTVIKRFAQWGVTLSLTASGSPGFILCSNNCLSGAGFSVSVFFGFLLKIIFVR